MRLPLCCLLLLIAVVPVGATEVTLQEALRAAVIDRPAVQAARAHADAAAAAVGEARGGWLPHLTVSERYTRTNEPAGSLFVALNQERNVMTDPAYDLIDPDIQDDFETRLQLSQTLYDPLVDYGLRQARTLQRAAAADAAWSAEEAAFAAFQAYLEVQRATAALAWVASSRREAEEIARLAGERHRAGTGLKADELRASVQLAEAHRREMAAGNDLILARHRLALAMGEAGGERQIAAPLEVGTFPTLTLPDTIDGRNDLAALAVLTEATGLDIEKSKAAWLPSLDLTAHYAWHDEDAPFGTDAESWAVGAGLSWELFDGLRRSATTARSVAEERAARARLEEARRETNFRLTEARLRSDEARLQLESARRAVTEAEEGQRLLQQRYSVGIADLVNLLAAQSALDRSRLDAVDAENRYLFSLGNVHFQAGRFLQTFLPGEVTPP